MTTMIQDKNGVIAATPSTMPSDRHFRNAWVFDSSQSAITEDLTAAKVIFKDKIREVRLPLLEAEDVKFQRALETGADTTDIVAEKQRLRDITNDVDAMTTEAQLRSKIMELDSG